MAKYLDQTGLKYFWGKIKGFVNSHEHPVGSVYITISSSFNPATQWGGTWSKIAEGQCLIQSGETYTLGSTGGEATHKLVTSEMPSHDHSLRMYLFSGNSNNGTKYGLAVNAGDGRPGGNGLGAWWNSYDWENTSDSAIKGTRIEKTGSDLAHNNMPPYLAVNIWKRTA